MIGRHGGSTAYQIVCHKNLDKFNRTKFIGAMNLGENANIEKTATSEHI
jgi:hypothetical protein